MALHPAVGIGMFFFAVIIFFIVYFSITSSDNFEEIPNNFNTDLTPINLTTNVIQNEPLENNMQSQNAIHNEIIGFKTI